MCLCVRVYSPGGAEVLGCVNKQGTQPRYRLLLVALLKQHGSLYFSCLVSYLLPLVSYLFSPKTLSPFLSSSLTFVHLDSLGFSHYQSLISSTVSLSLIYTVSISLIYTVSLSLIYTVSLSLICSFTIQLKMDLIQIIIVTEIWFY